MKQLQSAEATKFLLGIEQKGYSKYLLFFLLPLFLSEWSYFCTLLQRLDVSWGGYICPVSLFINSTSLSSLTSIRQEYFFSIPDVYRVFWCTILNRANGGNQLILCSCFKEWEIFSRETEYFHLKSGWVRCSQPVECVSSHSPAQATHLIPPDKTRSSSPYLDLAPHTPTQACTEFAQFYANFIVIKYLNTMILPGCQTSDSASSSKFHHFALLTALVLH